MPKFICPLDSCTYHTGQDCSIDFISVRPRSNDWDVTIECEHYNEKRGRCVFCGSYTQKNSKCSCILYKD